MEKEKKRIKLLILSIFIFALLILNNFIPFEQWIFRFKTPEEALKFDYTSKVEKILGKIEIDDLAYIAYVNKNGTVTDKNVLKDEKGWISPIKKIVLSNKAKTTNEYIIISYLENGKNIMTITNFSSSLNSNKIIKNVSDNIFTEFKNIQYTYNGISYSSWVGVIKEYPEDYKIYFDSEEVSL